MANKYDVILDEYRQADTAIGSPVLNTPDSNGILYVDSSGNLQNDQIQTQASSYFGGAVTGYELNSPDHTQPRFGFVNLSGIGQPNALAFATNSSTPMATYWIDTDVLTAYAQMYIDPVTPTNNRFSLGFHSGGLNSGNTFTVDGTEVDFKVLIDMNDNRITEVATPTAGTDAANKDYVDTEIAGIPSSSPGGSNAQLQYNDGGSFGGAALYYDDTKSYDNLGIGTTSPSAPLHVNESPGDTSDPALRVDLTSEYTGGSQQAAGRFTMTANDSSSSAFSGLFNTAETTGSSSSPQQLYGFQGEVIHAATAGTVTIAAGGALRSSNTGGGTITTNHGLVIYSALNTGGGDITANYGLKIDSQTVGSNNYSIWTDTGVVAFAGSLPTNYNQWSGGGAGKGIGFSYRNNTEVAAFNGYASVVNFEPRVEASANNDLLIGTYFLPSFADNGYTGLTKIGTMFQSTDPAAIAFKLRAASGQTADILQVVNNSNAPIFSIGAIGAFQQQITSDETLVAFNSVVQSTYSGSSEQVNFFQSFQAANAASATFINSDILMRTAGAGALSASKMVGQRITAYQQGGSGTVGSLVGQEVIIRNLSGGTGTVTNGIGLNVLSASNSSGTFTNNYGLKIENQTAATNNWAIHTGVGQVQFGDILKLSASTTSRATLNIPSGTAPTSPQNGDIWSDGSDIKVRLGGTTYTLVKI